MWWIRVRILSHLSVVDVVSLVFDLWWQNEIHQTQHCTGSQELKRNIPGQDIGPLFFSEKNSFVACRPVQPNKFLSWEESTSWQTGDCLHWGLNMSWLLVATVITRSPSPVTQTFQSGSRDAKRQHFYTSKVWAKIILPKKVSKLQQILFATKQRKRPKRPK